VRLAFAPHPHDPSPDVLKLAGHLDETGWDGIWVSDHFLPAVAPWSDPRAEVWTLLAALAVKTSRLRLGPMVLGVMYRHPAVVAKMAASVDILSSGRFILGMGAGWQASDHDAYGIPFPSLGERLRRMEEACRVVRLLTTQELTTQAGVFYSLDAAPLEPKPLQHPLPLLIGGEGEQVTLRIAAEWANAVNFSGPPDHIRHKNAVLDAHCRARGRDPQEIERTALVMVIRGDRTPDGRAPMEVPGPIPVIAGTADQIVAELAAYQAARVDEIVVRDFVVNRDRSLGPSTLGEGSAKRAALDWFQRDVMRT